MRIMLALTTMYLLFVPFGVAENQKELQPMFALFVKSVERVFELGNELWQKIGDGQAKDVLADVSSRAATLEVAKEKLKQDLLNDSISTQGELSSRIRELGNTVTGVARALEKFAREIDSAAQPAAGLGEDLRIQAGKVANSKLNELRLIASEWRPNDKPLQVSSIKHLDDAIADLHNMRCAVACLQKTIEQKKKACDPEKLSKPGALVPWACRREIEGDMMESVAAILLGVAAVAHLGFMLIEMFPWRRPFVFELVKLGFNPRLENEIIAAPIVHNAGLYNGFIAAGLFWGLCAGVSGFHERIFFLGCGILAGIFGAITLTPKTLFLQTLPAAAAMAAVYAAGQ